MTSSGFIITVLCSLNLGGWDITLHIPQQFDATQAPFFNTKLRFESGNNLWSNCSQKSDRTSIPGVWLIYS